MRNPFVTSGYAGPEYFCDRVKETKTLIDLLTNGNNVALISPRRIGKTDLIRHCFSQKEISEDYYTFIIDIYSTNSLCEFVNMFGKSITDSLRPFGRGVWEKFINTVTSLKSEISFDINGLPTWSVGLGNITNPSSTLDEIFKYLSCADKPCIVAIDEFQQITKYADGKSVEALLRTYIQHCSNANFVFSGSHRHLMGEIFTSPARPFFQSVTLFNLHPICRDKYKEFCIRHFNNAGKGINVAVVDELYDRFNSVTSYMQRIMNIMYARTEKGNECSVAMIDEAIDELLSFSSDTYDALLYQMTEKQRNVFIAIAAEGEAKSVSGGKFIRKYALQSSSSVMSAVKGLLEKDLITQDKDVYRVYDTFFTMWLRRMNII